MVKFKVLIIIVGIIIQNNQVCKAQSNAKIDTIYLNTDNYQIVYDDTIRILDLKISETMYRRLRKEKDFVILLSYKNNDYILKGNYYYNSFVPENCDFFFPINKRGKIIWFDKNILSLIKVAKPSR